MPRRLVGASPEDIHWEAYEEQALAPGQVRIRSRHGAAKHGTEQAFLKGYGALRGTWDPEHQVFIKGEKKLKRAMGLGNMVVGTVIELGAGVERLAEGDRVLAHGGFRETVQADAKRCWKLPESLSWKSAVCLDPADFAMAAVRDGHVRVGDAVAVFGLGAIGLMAVQLAKCSGAYPVIGVDPLANRREAAHGLGCDFTLDPTACDAGLEIKKQTQKRGADVILEYSGSHHALQAALRGVAFGGNLVAGAFPPPYGAGLDFGSEAHHNRPNLIFSRACSDPNREHPRWTERRIHDACWRLLCEGKLNGEPIVTPVVSSEALAGEYAKITTNPEVSIKLGVDWSDSD